MNTDRDMTRIVQSWLRRDEHESADQVLDDVLALLDATPQRRPWRPARRSADMNRVAKVAIAAAAVVVVAVVGINLLPTPGGVGGPTATVTTTVTLSPSPSPSPAEPVFPPAGPLAAGTHWMTRGLSREGPGFCCGGTRLSFEVPGGWHSAQPGFIDKDGGPGPDGASLLFWDFRPAGVYADPCAHRIRPVDGTSAAELAAAVATVPGTKLVSGPSTVSVDGRYSRRVTITIPLDARCPAGDGGFYLWYALGGRGSPCDGIAPCPRYPTELGVTIRVWIVDLGGSLLFIEAESYKDAGPNVEQEIQAIINSIRFD